MLVTGDRARYVDLFDKVMADEADENPLYEINLAFTKTEKGVKVGSINVFKAGLDTSLPPQGMKGEELREWQAWQQTAHQAKLQTEYLQEYFFQAEGRWIEWGLRRCLALYDEFGGSAKFRLLVPKLGIKVIRSAKSVARGRGDLDSLFVILRDIDPLLDGEYTLDPWSGTIRRGPVNAEASKR